MVEGSREVVRSPVEGDSLIYSPGTLLTVLDTREGCPCQSAYILFNVVTYM